MFDGLLPIGSVVLLKDSTKKLMIIGYCQRSLDDNRIWDYAGCLYPEGFLGADKNFLFDIVQVEHVYALGYQDEEQFAFKVKMEAIRQRILAEAASDRTP